MNQAKAEAPLSAENTNSIGQACLASQAVPKGPILEALLNELNENTAFLEELANTLEDAANTLLGAEPPNPQTSPQEKELSAPGLLGQVDQRLSYQHDVINRIARLTDRIRKVV